MSQWNGKSWIPFLVKDLQLEAVMLNPYIRKTLESKPDSKSKSLKSTTVYTTRFQFPDTYGVFTLKVEYHRRGWSNLLASEIIVLKPYRHDEYERFIIGAWPYYSGVFSMMGGVIVFSGVWLWNKDPVSQRHSKSE